MLKQDIMTIWEAESPSAPQATQTNKHGGFNVYSTGSAIVEADVLPLWLSFTSSAG